MAEQEKKPGINIEDAIWISVAFVLGILIFVLK